MTTRTKWTILQWMLGIVNAFSGILDFSNAHYTGAALSALAVLLTARWNMRVFDRE